MARKFRERRGFVKSEVVVRAWWWAWLSIAGRVLAGTTVSQPREPREGMASGEVTLTCCVSSVLQRKPQAITRPPTMDDPSLPVVPAAPGPAPSATAPRVPFHCSECGKSFRYRSDLRRHFARHTALKPHACPRCGKGFKHSFNLANHLRSHTGERPYRCSACPKGFRDSTGLLHHQVSSGSQTWPTYWDSIPLKERQLEMPLARKFL